MMDNLDHKDNENNANYVDVDKIKKISDQKLEIVLDKEAEMGNAIQTSNDDNNVNVDANDVDGKQSGKRKSDHNLQRNKRNKRKGKNESGYILPELTIVPVAHINIDNIDKEKTKYDKKGKKNMDDIPTNVRGVPVPKLQPDEIKMMLNKEKGFYHTFENGFMVPYVLPFDRMPLVCPCSMVFDGKSGSKARDHLKNCVPTMDTDEYKNLVYVPQYPNKKQKMCLRIHLQRTILACICGHKDSYYDVTQHLKECLLVKKSLLQYEKDSDSSESVQYWALPHVVTTYGREGKSHKNLIEEKDIKREKKGYQLLQPFGDSSVNFYIPVKNEIGNRALLKALNKLDVTVSIYWDEIVDLIATQQPVLINANKWGATQIQSHRQEIMLDFDKTVNDNQMQCWAKFCDNFKFEPKYMDTILNFAKQITKDDLGTNVFQNGKVDTPSLIMCKVNYNQCYHLDIMDGKMRKQYGMMVSNKGSTTMFCKPTSKEKVTNLEILTKVLKNAIVMEGEEGKWMAPSDALLEEIKALPPQTSQTIRNLEEGWGDLFYICRADKIHSDNFDFVSTKVSNVPMGTYYSSEGGIIHAGSGAEHSGVRTILFWTWHSSHLNKYDSNSQETKLSLMIALASEVWVELCQKEDDWNSNNRTQKKCLKLKKEMLRLLFYCFITMEDGYQKTCSNTFANWLGVPELIMDFHKCTVNTAEKNYKAPIEDLIMKHLKNNKLFEYLENP